MEKRTDYSTNKYTLLYLPKWDRCTRFIFMFTAIQCLSCQTNFRLLLSTCGHHTKCPGSNHAKKKLVFAYLVVDYLKQLNRARWFCRSYRWIVVRMIIVTDNWRWINCFTPHTWWVCKLHKKTCYLVSLKLAHLNLHRSNVDPVSIHFWLVKGFESGHRHMFSVFVFSSSTIVIV